MKNVSPRKEENENMPSMCIPSEGREVKSVFQHLSHQTNQGQAERNLESRIPEVICCNSELSNSFQILKSRTIGMGHPGHYFQKALNSFTQKSRSQSLPSCLESKKLSCSPRDDNNKESLDPKEPDESENVDVITLKTNNIVSNETWFRTWPERGNEKIVSPHNNISGSNAECAVFNKEGDSLGCGEESSGKNHQNFQDNTLTNVRDSICKGVSDTQQSCHSLSPDTTFKFDTYTLKTNQTFPLQSSSLRKSDLSSNCDIENYNLSAQHSFSTKPGDSSGISPSKTPIPLTELLQNIPIAYSPVTRQLHIISPTNIHQQQSEKCGDFKKEVHQNGLKPLECIEEEGHGDMCINAVRCGEDDSLSFESPRSTLQRFGTSSLSRTDASSFSSIVSSLSDASPSSTNDDPDDLTSTTHGSTPETADCYYEEMGGTKAKRKGLSGFFSRSVFVWKSSRDHQSNNSSSSNNSCTGTPGWKLFGRLASKPPEQDVTTSLETNRLPESPASIRSTGSGSNRYEDVVASSSALILHNRPLNLPAKSQDEEQKHRQEYQQMIEAARKKELKEAKLRKKQLQRQLKVEEQLANAARIWNNEILPKWDMMKTSRKARELWWQGIPPSVRGKVWKLAIGNDLNVTHQLYNICLARAQERLRAADSVEVVETAAAQTGDNVDKEASMELIQLDIARTFPHLCIFQRGGPYYDMLHCLLGAYVCYRPDVGYVQGMSFIAAVLILNLEAADAFICFANLLNRPCHMAFFCLNQTLMNAYYAAYNDFFRENLPRLYTHFTESSLSADLYLLDWLYTVFAKAMPLDVACRVWDVFLRDGEEFLFKAALGVLHLHQEALLKLDFIHGAQFLTKLPDDLAADQLFRSIEAIHMNVGKQRFGEVLAHHIDKCQQEPS